MAVLPVVVNPALDPLAEIAFCVECEWPPAELAEPVWLWLPAELVVAV